MNCARLNPLANALSFEVQSALDAAGVPIRAHSETTARALWKKATAFLPDWTLIILPISLGAHGSALGPRPMTIGSGLNVDALV